MKIVIGNYALYYRGVTLVFPQACAIDLKGMLILDRYFVRVTVNR